jgi:AcrR family transcriptional regulator
MDNVSLPEVRGVVVKQERSAISTRALLDAAAELIVEVGYEKATFAAIAERAGYSHGLVTRRFGSKEAMLHALVDRITHTTPPLAPEKVDGVGSILRTFDVVRAGLMHSESNIRALYVLMFTSLWSVPVLKERMADLHRDGRRAIAKATQVCINRGEVDPSVDPDEIGRSVLTSLRGCAYQWLLDPEDFDLNAALAEQKEALRVRLLRGGVSTGGTVE